MTAQNKGFTLVELLVVIAIIAVLSTVGLVVYSMAQKSGRMSKRIQDLKAIQTALEIYYSVNKKYPTYGNTSWTTECSGWITKTADNVIPGLVPKYMPAFPSDPAMDMDPTYKTSCYLYRSDTDGTGYKLMDYHVAEFTSADYLNQKNLVETSWDGGTECSKVDGPSPEAWAVISANTGVNDSGTNPACWQ